MLHKNNNVHDFYFALANPADVALPNNEEKWKM